MCVSVGHLKATPPVCSTSPEEKADCPKLSHYTSSWERDAPLASVLMSAPERLILSPGQVNRLCSPLFLTSSPSRIPSVSHTDVNTHTHTRARATVTHTLKNQ